MATKHLPGTLTTMVELQFTGVGVSFGARAVINNLSLQITPGEFVCLLGPSGCGKSTFLRVGAGLLEPTAGKVTRTQGALSFVFQEPRLLPWRTVRENVLLPLDLNPRHAPDIEVLLRQVGLWEEREFYPHQLSGGMKQRVSIARALICEPNILLLDEPFAALDEGTRHDLEDLLRKIWEERDCTMIFVTHGIREAVFLGERVLVMGTGGRILYDQQMAFERAPDLRWSGALNQRAAEVSRAVRGLA